MNYEEQNETSNKILYNNDKKNKNIDIDNMGNNNVIIYVLLYFYFYDLFKKD